MPWLDVYALDKHLCRIKTEPGWTGRELKEAIEEETGWDDLVCTQQLAVGSTLISHDVQMDSVLTGDADASMARLPEPANIQAFTGDRKALGLAMRPLEISPSWRWSCHRTQCSSMPRLGSSGMLWRLRAKRLIDPKKAKLQRS